MSDCAVVFTPSGRRGRFAPGTSLLAAARALGVDLDSVCGGRGLCGRCQVELQPGEHLKHAITSAPDHLTAAGEVEARFAARRGALAPGRRLGCQARLAGDVVVDVPADSQLHRQVVAKAADARPVTLDPVVTLHHVVVAQPDMHDPRSDARRLEEAVAAEWGITGLVMPLPVLAGLQRALREGGWAVTVALRHRRDVVAVHPGLVETLHGVAVDLGSTTIAAHLCDLGTGGVVASAGEMNPQIRFGEDLMSRVSYAMMNEGGAAALTAAARDALARLVGSLARQAGIEASRIAEVTVAGNPVMHHLLLGLDPVELGAAPFALAADAALDLPARDLGLAIAPGAFVHVLPCIAGHVGADAAAMVLAERPDLSEELTLLVDVGTNAEIVLGDRHGLLACSSPTGPAFEGAQITAGQRAAPGAIERVRIDPATLEPRFKVIGCNMWSDEPGFAEAVRRTGVTGICGSGIIEAIAEMHLAGILRTDGGIDGALAARSRRVREEYRSFTYLIREEAPRIAVTQHDVRAIQLAKAALHAGAKLLMHRRGVDRVERIRLAGAFGAHIDPLHALVLGLVPDCAPERIASVGNAAGHGARIALLNAAARRELQALVRRIEKVETAVEPGFQAEFVAAMAIPHATDPYPELAARVALPARSAPRRPARRRAGAPGD
ncbi:ASKHA domain-containing protein [Falsiroseomonas sp. CW058]|uniref:ASKHA domain-containing protein n=1 Tax=Falsiroseomonas sp. CW058 TaxID=3388664 RepID=UPI003D317DBA